MEDMYLCKLLHILLLQSLSNHSVIVPQELEHSDFLLIFGCQPTLEMLMIDA